MSSQLQVTVKQIDPVTVAFISMRGAYSQIPEAIGRLFTWVEQKGLVPAGPPMGVYYDTSGQVPEEQSSWEIRCWLAGDAAETAPDSAGLGVKKTPGATVATVMHKGPFDQVGPTWEGLMQWIMANGYEIAGPGTETYMSDPDVTPPEELLTEIQLTVRKKGR